MDLPTSVHIQALFPFAPSQIDSPTADLYGMLSHLHQFTAVPKPFGPKQATSDNIGCERRPKALDGWWWQVIRHPTPPAVSTDVM